MKINPTKSIEALVQWGYAPHGDPSQAQCLCGQAFGFRGPKKIDEAYRIPGPPNEEMGRLTRQLVVAHSLPFSIQGEIAQTAAMASLIEKPGDFATDTQQVIYHNPIPGKYVSCYTIETLTWEWMKAHDWTRVAIITHPLLCWRMERVLLRLAKNDGVMIEVIVPEGLETIGYDPWHNAQWRCWNEQFWWCYEVVLARQHHVLFELI